MQDDFIRKIIREDVDNKKHESIRTRFPPEPNGYLHVGHAKSIVLNFALADEFQGLCQLRFDDTNPEREQSDYVEAIIEDIQWLGFPCSDNMGYTSDYFEKIYQYAVLLIQKDLAYVDHSSKEEIRLQRGTPTELGSKSKYRSRTVAENLDLFEKMRLGQMQEGDCLLRAKIDMSHPNITMRDPVIYRIKKHEHHKTGAKWCIYPMYDFAHCLSDAIGSVTHSLCTLEFEVHRPLYEWFIDNLEIAQKPRQIEFARLNLSHTLLSKRKLKYLIDNEVVDSWDDPRLATLSGLRRRGYTARSIRNFCAEIGVTKFVSLIEQARLEESLRRDLNEVALRMMVVLDPIKLCITNYPEDKEEFFEVHDNPEDEHSPLYKIPFSRVLYIEREDFSEDPPKKFFRLGVGREVRLKYAYYVRCTDFVKDKDGKIVEIHAEYDPRSRGGWTEDERKVRGTLHWVSQKHAVDIEVNNYTQLFTDPQPEQIAMEDLDKYLVKGSHQRVTGVKAEPRILELQESVPLQFLRKGYYILDKKHSEARKVLNFNHTIALKEGRKPVLPPA